MKLERLWLWYNFRFPAWRPCSSSILHRICWDSDSNLNVTVHNRIKNKNTTTIVERGKIDTTYTQIHDHFFWLGTNTSLTKYMTTHCPCLVDTSITIDGVKLVLSKEASYFCEIKRSNKWFPHVSKMPTFHE